MRYSTTLSVLSGIAALSTFTMAHPLLDEELVRRDSPDETCGGTNGYICGSTNSGTCCSQYGYCGSTTAYCGDGCQTAFGNCTVGTGGGTGGGGGTTDPNLCGPTNGNNICGSGQCCSPAGYCGTTEDYCASPDCLRGFGVCDSDKTPAGSSTADIPRPELGSVPYGEDIYDCQDPRSIALTYDDGPYIYTNDLLDKLQAYGFKATFFITGVNNGKGPIDSTPAWSTVIQRMITDGHQVASHTWSHADLSTLSDADRETEMIKNEMALRNIIGKIPTYMRPPYSSCTDACKATMKKLGYHITYFDLDTQDYLHTTPETNQLSKDVVHGYLAANSTPDYLSIAHDIHEQTVHNLTTYMFDQMVYYGYKGVTAGVCKEDPEANWYRIPGTTTPTNSSSSTTSTTSSSTSASSDSTTTTTSDPTTTTSSSSTTTTDDPTTTTSSSSTTTSSSSSTTTTSSSSTTTTTSSSSSTKTTSSSTRRTTTTSSSKSKTSTTSSSKTSTIKSSPTRKTTTPAPTPTSNCPYPQVGNWCCKPFSFDSRVKCLISIAECAISRAECILKSGLDFKTASHQCGTWSNNVCQKLSSYCNTCKLFQKCDGTKFTP